MRSPSSFGQIFCVVFAVSEAAHLQLAESVTKLSITSLQIHRRTKNSWVCSTSHQFIRSAVIRYTIVSRNSYDMDIISFPYLVIINKPVVHRPGVHQVFNSVPYKCLSLGANGDVSLVDVWTLVNVVKIRSSV